MTFKLFFILEVHPNTNLNFPCKPKYNLFGSPQSFRWQRRQDYTISHNLLLTYPSTLNEYSGTSYIWSWLKCEWNRIFTVCQSWSYREKKNIGIYSFFIFLPNSHYRNQENVSLLVTQSKVIEMILLWLCQISFRADYFSTGLINDKLIKKT